MDKGQVGDRLPVTTWGLSLPGWCVTVGKNDCPCSPLLLAKLSSFRTKFHAQSRVQVAVQLHARVHRYDAPCPSSILHTRDDAQAGSVAPCSSSFFVQEIEIKTPHTHHFVFCNLLPSGRFWCEGPKLQATQIWLLLLLLLGRGFCFPIPTASLQLWMLWYSWLVCI